jgi:hypothetical protein
VPKALTVNHSPTWRRAPRKRRLITPAAAWTPKESQKRVRIARLEDPELHIPNKLKFEIPDRPQAAFWI